MPTRWQEDKTTLVLLLTGELGVADAAEMKRQLIEGMSSPKLLHLDFSQVGDVDVAVIQLLWATVADGKKAGKALVMRGPVPGSLTAAIAEAGLVDFLTKKVGPAGSQPNSTEKPND